LWFDPTADLHLYTIEWTQNAITYVQTLHRWVFFGTSFKLSWLKRKGFQYNFVLTYCRCKVWCVKCTPCAEFSWTILPSASLTTFSFRLEFRTSITSLW
jgi:hypothetical protein